MIKFKLFFQIGAVIGSMLIAGIVLFQESDPQLKDTKFVTVQSVDDSETDEVTQPTAVEIVNERSAEDMTTDQAVSNFAVTDDQLESVSESNAQDERSDIRTEYTVTVRILGTQPTITCTVPAATASTVHHVMQQASTQCSFIYRGKNFSELGFFVEQIGDLASDTANGMYWIYAVNGVKAVLGVSEQMVQPGDTISWNYEAEY